MPAVGSLLHARHARRGSAAVALIAGVVVLTTSATPAQAFVSAGPRSSDTATASVASSLAHRTTSSTTTKRVVTSAVAATKARGAKAAPTKAGLSPARILATARKYDGSYYRHGGTTPAGFDCSGYTRYVFGKLGKSLPHNAAAQYATVRHVSRSSARPGDLIFFHSSSGHVYHVGIFAGHGRLYHASEYGVRTGLGTIFSSNITFGRV